MARRNRSEGTQPEANTPEVPQEETVSTTETEPQAPAAEGTESSTPEAAPVDLTPFKTAAQAAANEADESTGDVPVASVEAVLVEYRKLDGAKAKNQAKSFLNGQMKEHMNSMQIAPAKAYMQLTDKMTAGGGTKAADKAPADPTEAAVQRIATLQLARQFVVVGEGVGEDLQERVDKLVTESGEGVEGYLTWLQADEESRGDEPEASLVVKNAAKLALGKAAKAGGNKSGGTFSGERKDIGKHILEAFASQEDGAFLTVAEIRKFTSEEYGNTPPSAGAISARLFPQSGKCTLVEQGIQPDTNEKSNKGARKVAVA